MKMLELLKNEYCSYLQSLVINKEKVDCACVVRYEESDESDFDLMDKQERIIQKLGDGCVSYHIGSDKIIAVDYENMLNQFSGLKHGVGRCDFLCYSKAKNSFFIANELSTGKIESKWPKAAKQLGDTIKYLLYVAPVKDFISNYCSKVCLVSCRENKIVSPLGMADVFGVPFTLVKYVQKKDWKPIEKYGFEVYEATNVYFENNSLKFTND